MRQPIAAAALLLFAACGEETGPLVPPPAPPPTSASGLTWYQDIAPIFEAHCTTCHVAGGIAPFALTDYSQANALGALIKSTTANRLMPPWPPGGATPELAHDRTLSDEAIAAIGSWV